MSPARNYGVMVAAVGARDYELVLQLGVLESAGCQSWGMRAPPRGRRLSGYLVPFFWGKAARPEGVRIVSFLVPLEGVAERFVLGFDVPVFGGVLVAPLVYPAAVDTAGDSFCYEAVFYEGAFAFDAEGSVVSAFVIDGGPSEEHFLGVGEFDVFHDVSFLAGGSLAGE
ncbi:hypothetical protein [Corynebacterium macginleyi]|uniref:hypothetical protein n=1 Tax=Corynebacterium macginleyi TaxID=38290 RepID=UPI00190B9446|nr:hypothetical protein [Corynebacterium macginleyi]MBK4183168.1 hypothetical protein [Corynebacterium macginleyi]